MAATPPTEDLPHAADPPHAITVLVVDDHVVFAELLAIALSVDTSFRFIGHARTGAEAVRLVAELDPDVVLMDVQLPDIDGLTVTERLLADDPQRRVVVLTAHADPSLVARAAAAGVRGFLPKDGALGDVIQALRTAHDGGMVVSADLIVGMLRHHDRTGQRPVSLLTTRESDVLRLMGCGLDVRAIARQLDISPHTCRGYVKNILSKLNAHSQLEAVIVALRHGLLSHTELS